MTTSRLSKVRVISLDVTGTLLVFRQSVAQTYVDALNWANLADPPTVTEFGQAYKKAFKQASLEYPCFGAASDNMPAREWWRHTAVLALKYCGRTEYTSRELDRFYRRVYQQYGDPNSYEILPDAFPFLEWLVSQRNKDSSPKYILGITSNTDRRVVETIIPLLKLHHYFHWFVCSEDFGFEKPDKRVFEEGFALSKDWMPKLENLNQMLHIGDSLPADFCAAKAAGLQALFLDRSGNDKVVVYQDWLKACDYLGKTDDDIERHTVRTLADVQKLLSDS
jgi:REG-2-like HAD superfamily hydrolase